MRTYHLERNGTALGFEPKNIRSTALCRYPLSQRFLLMQKQKQNKNGGRKIALPKDRAGMRAGAQRLLTPSASSRLLLTKQGHLSKWAELGQLAGAVFNVITRS